MRALMIDRKAVLNCRTVRIQKKAIAIDNALWIKPHRLCICPQIARHIGWARQIAESASLDIMEIMFRNTQKLRNLGDLHDDSARAEATSAASASKLSC